MCRGTTDVGTGVLSRDEQRSHSSTGIWEVSGFCGPVRSEQRGRGCPPGTDDEGHTGVTWVVCLRVNHVRIFMGNLVNYLFSRLFTYLRLYRLYTRLMSRGVKESKE